MILLNSLLCGGLGLRSRRRVARSGGRTSARAGSRAGCGRRRPGPSTSSPRREVADRWPSTSTVAATSGERFVTTRSCRADDERARVQRVRRDEGEHHRVEPPDEHRAAVREVVGGRAGRGRADQRRRTAACRAPRRRSRSRARSSGRACRRDDDVVDGDAGARRRRSTSSVGSDEHRGTRRRRRARVPASSSSAAIAVRKPTRPKLTPSTGTPVPRKRASARSIVPSPPSTIAMSGDVRRRARRRACRLVRRTAARRPAASATARRRATASPTSASRRA